MASLADVVGGIGACGSCLRRHGLIGCLRLSGERQVVQSYEQQEDGKGNPYDPCTRKSHACLQALCGAPARHRFPGETGGKNEFPNGPDFQHSDAAQQIVLSQVSDILTLASSCPPHIFP